LAKEQERSRRLQQLHILELSSLDEANQVYSSLHHSALGAEQYTPYLAFTQQVASTATSFALQVHRF